MMFMCFFVCSQETSANNTTLNNIEHLPTVDELNNEPTVDELDDEPTVEELKKSISSLAVGKAPGKNGIPPEAIRCARPCSNTFMNSSACAGMKEQCHKT